MQITPGATFARGRGYKEGVSRETCSQRRGVSVPPDLGVLVVGMLPWRAGEPEMLQDDHEDLIVSPGSSA
jgi:hypothetical protein